MTCNIMFAPNANGVPLLNSNKPGEAACIKIPKQFHWLYDHKGSIDEECGKRMALWATGGGSTQPQAKARQTPQEYVDELIEKIDQCKDAVGLSEIDRKSKVAMDKLSKDEGLSSLHDRAAKAFRERRNSLELASDAFEISEG